MNTDQVPMGDKASSIDDFYVGHEVIVDGYWYIIKRYDGKTKLATIHGEWRDDPNPESKEK